MAYYNKDSENTLVQVFTKLHSICHPFSIQTHGDEPLKRVLKQVHYWCD
jgi:hypothetical protein